MLGSNLKSIQLKKNPLEFINHFSMCPENSEKKFVGDSFQELAKLAVPKRFNFGLFKAFGENNNKTHYMAELSGD